MESGARTLENNKTITVGITGASGVIYGLRLLEVLIEKGCRLYVVISKAGRLVLETEANLKLPEDADAMTVVLAGRFSAAPGQLRVYGIEDWFSPLASGSGAPKQMVICPCTGGALSSIATGASENLLERAADVVLKERGQLIVVPREMPLSTIHLENMLKLSRMGVTVIPACPGFYNSPKTIGDIVNSVVSRILDHLGIEHQLTGRWGRDDG